MIKFTKVVNTQQIELFAKYKVLLMTEINNSAIKMGITDKDIKDYNLARAKKNLSERDSYLVSTNGKYIGMFQISIKESICTKKQIAYLHNLYIEQSYRKKGIGRQIIKFILTLYGKSIECECWYEMEASSFYQSLGFRCIQATFYSDQNCMSENKK